jgi:hypothetical protein
LQKRAARRRVGNTNVAVLQLRKRLPHPAALYKVRSLKRRLNGDSFVAKQNVIDIVTEPDNPTAQEYLAWVRRTRLLLMRWDDIPASLTWQISPSNRRRAIEELDREERQMLAKLEGPQSA